MTSIATRYGPRSTRDAFSMQLTRFRLRWSGTLSLLVLLLWMPLAACAPVQPIPSVPISDATAATTTPVPGAPIPPAVLAHPAEYAEYAYVRQWAVVHAGTLYTVHRGSSANPIVSVIEQCAAGACAIGHITWSPGGSYLLYTVQPLTVTGNPQIKSPTLRAVDAAGTVHVLRTLSDTSPARLPNPVEATSVRFVPYTGSAQARDDTLLDPADLAAYFDTWVAEIEDEGQFATSEPPGELLPDLDISDSECRNPDPTMAEGWPCLPDAPDSTPAPVPGRVHHPRP